MAKKRVHEVAKELNMESKELLKKLADLGIEAKCNFSTLSEEEIAKVKAALENKEKGTEEEPGLVDKVPSRPPDRRLIERPAAFEKKLAPKLPSPAPAPEPPKPAPEKKVLIPPKPPTEKPPEGERPPREKRPPRPPEGKRPPRPERAPDKGPRPLGEKRPFKAPSLPSPPPPAEKPKERKPEKKMKGKPVDHLIPQWEEEGEKLKSKLVLRRPKEKEAAKEALPEKTGPRVIQIGETVTIKELAEKMQRRAAELIKKLMDMGMLVTINQEIDADTATILAHEFGCEVEVKPAFDVEALLAEEPETDPSKLKPRPPIVTVMGHVDHGKTTLLDAIRETRVAATEAGGITQHIGAYQVEKDGRKITFIDTPGHEAFTAMRARGAKVTDIAVLVVAADDGVKPQTVEAINHARAAGVPIIVAINKMDKPEANPDRVKTQLAELGLVPEEWGGDTIMQPISALKRQGIDELLEMILLVADMLELKANPERPARGTIIESRLDRGRGPVATVIVQNGTLKVGDTLVAGTQFARVRAMIDDRGRKLSQAGPSTPVEVLGFSEVPEAGETFVVVEERLAKQIVEKRLAKKQAEEAQARAKMLLEDVYQRIKEGQIKELPLVVKADVQGSLEAICRALSQLRTEEVGVNIIHAGVGAITETDIMLASASGAIIIGFNVRPDVNARKALEKEKVDVRLYQVIYDAIKDVKAALSGLLEPEYREVLLGRAEVRKTFHVSRLGTIAGCYVQEGKVTRDAQVRVIRDGVVIHTGKVSSLKRFKDDVKEVSQGFECGLMIENFNDIKEGDELEFFVMEAVQRTLD
ncbi:translation initiation factor IF-2 [Ammonifex thiophilus]|uniref:Translation initiation factor IF-2 n=1 Tax=Ammonifex thiophilus TaxID=444093 RepID=A0A3D8P2I5_9THEO|nr:translation initiation factor IF-2 [Ammonifex thiophilus]RDV82517.1 translation initiation factor IF-2 [Ammonifex thiophilus]